MESIAVTRLSSKGQVVIPQEIRERMGLREGCRFVVVADRGGVFLRIIERPDMSRFDELLRSVRKKARAAGLKKSDITDAIKRVRQRRRRAA